MSRCFLYLALIGLAASIDCSGIAPPTPSGAGGGSLATGSGGTFGTGGSIIGGGAGGRPPDASAPCTAGSVTFHMTAAEGNNSDYCVGGFCTTEVFAVTDSSGLVFPRGSHLDIALGCNSPCDSCRNIDCSSVCEPPQPMNPDGERLTWDGTYYQWAVCGGTITCGVRRCAPPGTYTVRMCAKRDQPDSGVPICGTPWLPAMCTNVTFDYPSTEVVEGVLR